MRLRSGRKRLANGLFSPVPYKKSKIEQQSLYKVIKKNLMEDEQYKSINVAQKDCILMSIVLHLEEVVMEAERNLQVSVIRHVLDLCKEANAITKTIIDAKSKSKTDILMRFYREVGQGPIPWLCYRTVCCGTNRIFRWCIGYFNDLNLVILQKEKQLSDIQKVDFNKMMAMFLDEAYNYLQESAEKIEYLKSKKLYRIGREKILSLPHFSESQLLLITDSVLLHLVNIVDFLQRNRRIRDAKKFLISLEKANKVTITNPLKWGNVFDKFRSDMVKDFYPILRKYCYSSPGIDLLKWSLGVFDKLRLINLQHKEKLSNKQKQKLRELTDFLLNEARTYLHDNNVVGVKLQTTNS